jgi:menaquinone-9 beta-reductase
MPLPDCPTARLPDSVDAEVVVVGGGPAGAATALHLAQRGRQVILLEGRDLAHERAAELRSGEVLSPGGQRELVRLGLPTRDAGWRYDDFTALRNHWPGGRVTLDPLPRGLVYWQTNRGQLDRALVALARAAGVAVYDGQRVSDLLRDDQGAVCGVITKAGRVAGRAWRAPIVVDASGRYSAILARLDAKRPDPEFRRSALVSFYDWVPDCARGVWEQHFFAIHNSAVKGAMMAPGLYRFSLEIDLAARDAYARRYGAHTPHALTLAILRDLAPHLYERFRAARPLPHSTAYAPLAYRVPRITYDGLLLVGDVAGYLDPGTGQGIEFALRSARLAAAVIDDALAAHDYRAARFVPYVAARQRELARAMAWLRLYLRVSQQRAALNACGRLAPARAALIRAMVRG